MVPALLGSFWTKVLRVAVDDMAAERMICCLLSSLILSTYTMSKLEAVDTHALAWM